MSRVKTEESRSAIVEAAARLFSEKHFDCVLMQDVAEAAGVGKGTVYRYFKDKDELYLAVHCCGVDMWTKQLERIATADLNPSEKLADLLGSGMRFASEHQAFWQLISRGDPCRRDKGQEEWHQRRNKVQEIARKIIEEGVKAGEFRAVNVELVVSIIRHCTFSPVKGMFGSIEEGAAQCMDLLLDGMRRRGDRGLSA